MRRRVAAAPEPASDIYAHYLRSPTRRNPDAYDTPIVMAFWELLKSLLTATLSPTEGLLGELISFWTIAQNFIDGKTQKSLPIGYDESAIKHHRLSDDKVAQLRKGAEEILHTMVQSVTDFFGQPPIDDISALVSPIPPLTPDSSIPVTPSASMPTTPLSATLPGGAPSPWLFKKPPSNPADIYAFLPPNGNSVASTHYLSQILGILGTAAAELAKLPIGRRATDQLRAMVTGARERCAHAVCHAWQNDAANFKLLEDWTRASNNKSITKLPSQFLAVERAIILGLQEILHYNKAKTDPNNPVIIPPATSLLNFVKNQFRRSLSTALKGMLENAVKIPKKRDEDEDEVAETVNNNASSTTAGQSGLAFSVDKNDPVVKDTLYSIDKELFEAYTKPHAEALAKTIREGLLSPNWIPQTKALIVTPYIHQALLQIVLVHSQVVTTTSTLLQRIISFMLESFSYNMLSTFKSHPTERFGLNALLQATLDVEFVNQTLGQFVTQRAQELQSEIYVELDRRSDGPSRAALHKELADLRNVLMGLRRNTRAEFLCFRQKRGSKGPGN
ncbi:hypothetical protein ABW19_dt0205879 [Dactylella cylindrospora]|nr:hypothetical protein ABW19_dt0205879 [Dactylella cylindrospora]